MHYVQNVIASEPFKHRDGIIVESGDRRSSRGLPVNAIRKPADPGVSFTVTSVLLSLCCGGVSPLPLFFWRVAALLLLPLLARKATVSGSSAIH